MASASHETPKRSVSFAQEQDLCVFHAGAVMDIEEVCREDIWYQHAELSEIKRKAMSVAKEAHRYGLGTLLSNTYGKSSESAQESLNNWARNGNSRRGLERWINNEYAAKRSDIRRRTVKSVLRAQRKLFEDGVDDPVYSMKVLSRLSEAFSKDSRNFARVLGLADEHAASTDSATDTERDETTKECVPPLRQSSPRSVAFQQFAAAPSRRRHPGLSRPANDMRHFY